MYFTTSYAEQKLIDELEAAEARGKARAAARDARKAQMKAPGATPWCGKCGRKWRSHYYRLRTMILVAAIALGFGWLGGMAAVAVGAVHAH